MVRRYFLFGSFATVTAARSASFQSANDRVRIACVGFNNQGRAHIDAYTKMPDVEVAALCDTDDAVLERGCGMVAAAGRKRPAVYTDIRKLLEDKSIDAVSIATPNHQHTLQAIWACQAGKDVYVEKPCAHNVFEARQIVAAARKYNRVMQHGTGASAVLHETREKLREGIVGDLYMARALCFKMRNTIGRAPVEPVPAGVHYDLWLGPAPKHSFTQTEYHYNFPWFGTMAPVISATRESPVACARWVGSEVSSQSKRRRRAFPVRRRSGNSEYAVGDLRIQRWREEKDAGVRGPPLVHK